MKKILSLLFLLGSLSFSCLADDLNCESQKFFSDENLENIKDLTPNSSISCTNYFGKKLEIKSGWILKIKIDSTKIYSGVGILSQESDSKNDTSFLLEIQDAEKVLSNGYVVYKLNSYMFAYNKDGFRVRGIGQEGFDSFLYKQCKVE